MNDARFPSSNRSISSLAKKEAEGIYSMRAIITHSPAEFVIDFTRVLPGVPKARVHARVIMTAQHAKLLHRALEDNIAKYEMKFGEIKIHGEGPSGFGFQPVVVMRKYTERTVTVPRAAFGGPGEQRCTNMLP